MKAGGRRLDDEIYADAQTIPPPGEQPTDEPMGDPRWRQKAERYEARKRREACA